MISMILISLLVGLLFVSLPALLHSEALHAARQVMKARTMAVTRSLNKREQGHEWSPREKERMAAHFKRYPRSPLKARYDQAERGGRG